MPSDTSDVTTMHKDDLVYAFVAILPDQDPMLPTSENNLIIFETIDRAVECTMGHPGKVIGNSLGHFCDVAGMEGWGVLIQAANGDLRKVLGYEATSLFNPGGVKHETHPLD